MPVIGFNFTKLHIAKKEEFRPGFEFSSNVTITKVEEKEYNLSKDETLALFEFEFNIGYDKAGSINIDGKVTYLGSKKEVKEVVEGWKKDKTMDSIILKIVLNTILYKSNVRALEMSELVGLPAPFNLPFIRDEEKK